MSRVHARVDWDGTTLRIVDTKSSNGTFLNEQKVVDQQLNHGDILRMGETRMRIQQQRSARGGAPEQADSSVFGLQDAPVQDLNLSLSMSMIAPSREQQNTDPTVLQKRLRAIIDVSEALSSVADPNHLYKTVLDVIFSIFPQTDRCYLALGKTVDKLVAKAFRAKSEDHSGGPTVSRSIVSKALSDKEAFIFRPDDAGADFDQGMSIVTLKIRSAIAMPLMVKEEVLGVVVIDTADRRRSFERDDLELAAAVCQPVAIAIKNAELVAQAEDDAATRNNLCRFLPKAMADQVLKGELDPGLGGRIHKATIFFSDIISFTAMCEGLAPEEVVALMNEYFNYMVPCIEREGGSIDKFMGDAIMAVWGIPIPDGQEGIKACTAALLMQNRLFCLNSLQAKDGKRQLSMGIGINTGMVTAGNIGAQERREYTVLGDAVNTAQRIESAAARDQVLCADSTWNDLSNTGIGVKLPGVAGKNKSSLIEVHSVRGIAGLDNECQLHIPVRTQGKLAVLTRRLADNSFIILHDPEIDLTKGALVSDLVEFPDASFGIPEIIAQLPAEAEDGALARSQISLEDPALRGLLTPGTPLKSEMTWVQMNRTESAKAISAS